MLGVDLPRDWQPTCAPAVERHADLCPLSAHILRVVGALCGKNKDLQNGGEGHFSRSLRLSGTRFGTSAQGRISQNFNGYKAI